MTNESSDETALRASTLRTSALAQPEPEASSAFDPRTGGEYRLFGPPGTGKTTWNARQIVRAAARYGSERILVTSFSKAAAVEIASRGLDIPRENCGTLHAICYRAIGGSIRIAESEVDEWNKENPAYRMTPSEQQSSSVIDDYAGSSGTPGDDALMAINRKRSRNPKKLEDVLNPLEKEFWQLWCEYKRHHHLLDFTDLLEIALRDIRIAPGNPAVLFADEAQDLTPLQLAIIRQWGHYVEYFVLAGDDDQLIYPHLGCIPEALLEPALPPERIKVLRQSYRVPRQIESFATEWINGVTLRQSKAYMPRDFEGTVAYSNISLEQLDGLGPLIDYALKHNETIMLLTTTNFQMRTVLTWLRQRGLPFHNPLRVKNGAWNPLSRRPGGTVQRLLALTAPHREREGRYWRQEELRQIVDWMAVDGNLNSGARQLLQTGLSDAPVSGRFLQRIFTPRALETLADALEGDTTDLAHWWQARLHKDRAKRAEYPVKILSHLGPTALTTTPSVLVGTIHSVKGGEADHVVLFPDITVSAASHARQNGYDSLLRVFYVGMTRAKQRLFLAEATGNLHMRWNSSYYGQRAAS